MVIEGLSKGGDMMRRTLFQVVDVALLMAGIVFIFHGGPSARTIYVDQNGREDCCLLQVDASNDGNTMKVMAEAYPDTIIEKTLNLRPGEEASLSDTVSSMVSKEFLVTLFYCCYYDITDDISFIEVSPRARLAPTTEDSVYIIIAEYTIKVKEKAVPGRYNLSIYYDWGCYSPFSPFWDTIIKISLVIEPPEAVITHSWGKIKTMFR